MKKLLAILAAVGISITGASSVMACGKDSTEECAPCDETPEQTNLRYLLGYVQTTIDEIDPGIVSCLGDAYTKLRNDITQGWTYLENSDTPPSEITELNIKILADHKGLWLKIIECSVTRNTELATN